MADYKNSKAYKRGHAIGGFIGFLLVVAVLSAAIVLISAGLSRLLG